eukprot:2116_1
MSNVDEKRDESKVVSKKIDSLSPNDVCNMKRHRNRNKPNKPVLFSYSPHPNHRTQSFLTISRAFTQTILPSKVSQRITNVYAFINKSTAMAYCDGNFVYFHCNSSVIYNYGLCDKQSDELLYCVADQKESKHKHCHYEMRDALFTLKDLEQMDLISPPSCRYPYAKLLHQKRSFEHKLRSCILHVICAVKWNNVPVFTLRKSEDKQRRTQFNTIRFVLKVTRDVFVHQLRQLCG